MKHAGNLILAVLLLIAIIVAFSIWNNENQIKKDVATLGHAFNAIVVNSGASPAVLPKTTDYNTLDVSSRYGIFSGCLWFS